jgi:DNA recombination protein RmuC
VLGEVKTEFKQFENVLASAQKKIRQADADLGELVGTRARQMQKKLKDVEELPSGESKLTLDSEELNLLPEQPELV